MPISKLVKVETTKKDYEERNTLVDSEANHKPFPWTKIILSFLIVFTIFQGYQVYQQEIAKQLK